VICSLHPYVGMPRLISPISVLRCYGITNDAIAYVVMPYFLHDSYVEDNRHMSTRLMLQVMEHSPQSGSKKLLLLAIAKFANDDGTGATPSVATLARLVGTKPRNVQYLLRDLEQSGELVCELHAGPDGCNHYTIIIPVSDADARDITDVQWDAEPPMLPLAPTMHSVALQGGAATCTQFKEGKKEGGSNAHPRKTHEDAPVATPPGERPLHADPVTLWRTGRVAVQSLDEAYLQTLAADLDQTTGGYGPYWLGRAILAASVCDAQFATNPRAINLVRAIIRRWSEEGSFGSDTRAYQSRLEHRHDHAQPTEQRLVAARGRYPVQPTHGPVRHHAPARATSPTTACTIIGRDVETE
jgi:hypothetical protein